MSITIQDFRLTKVKVHVSAPGWFSDGNGTVNNADISWIECALDRTRVTQFSRVTADVLHTSCCDCGCSFCGDEQDVEVELRVEASLYARDDDEAKKELLAQVELALRQLKERAE